jgi:hypothetical protein
VRKNIRNVYAPVRNAPTMPPTQRIAPKVPRARAEARMESFEKKPANGGMPTSESEPTRKPAHAPHVLLADERVDDETGGEEEERLEERVRHQVEHPVRVRSHADAEEHVADLRHRGVRDHPLDVRLDERDQPGE